MGRLLDGGLVIGPLVFLAFVAVSGWVGPDVARFLTLASAAWIGVAVIYQGVKWNRRRHTPKSRPMYRFFRNANDHLDVERIDRER